MATALEMIKNQKMRIRYYIT